MICGGSQQVMPVCEKGTEMCSSLGEIHVLAQKIMYI